MQQSVQTRSSVPAPVRGIGEDDCTALFHRWCHHRDRRARDELVQRFLPLARKLAHRYRGAHEPIEDLFQVASLGLVKAVDRFDMSRGTAFSSFAVPTILGELKRYFRDCGWSVHVPRGAQEQALKVEEAQQTLTTKRGRPPTVQKLAEYLELSVQDVLEALETAGAHHAASLDAPHADDEGGAGTLGSLFGAEDERYGLVEDGLTITAAARQLPLQERRVLQLRFIEDLTQTQIAKRIGVSQMQVSRVLRRAVARLNEFAEPESGSGGRKGLAQKAG
ncbi:MAG: SigB/SigF/SigG family RNA polymerase sigma factor [Solirubrobacteraceae bacterium]